MIRFIRLAAITVLVATACIGIAVLAAAQPGADVPMAAASPTVTLHYFNGHSYTVTELRSAVIPRTTPDAWLPSGARQLPESEQQHDTGVLVTPEAAASTATSGMDATHYVVSMDLTTVGQLRAAQPIHDNNLVAYSWADDKPVYYVRVHGSYTMGASYEGRVVSDDHYFAIVDANTAFVISVGIDPRTHW